MTLRSQQEPGYCLHIIIRHPFLYRHSSLWKSSEEEARSQTQLHSSKMDSQANCQAVQLTKLLCINAVSLVTYLVTRRRMVTRHLSSL